MCNLFYNKVSTVEIKNMGYKEMKYWNSCHEIIQQEYKNEADRLKNKGNK